MSLGQRLVSPASLLRWVERFQEGRRVGYELILGVGSTLNHCTFTFDSTRMQWSFKIQPFAHPSGGLVRYFCSIDLSTDLSTIFVGTTGGDVLVYRRDTTVFRACIPVCSNGVQSILCLPNGCVNENNHDSILCWSYISTCIFLIYNNVK